MKRRHFLAGTAATFAMVSGGIAAGNSNVVPVLEARPGKARLLPDSYPETDIWGYNGGVPGPAIHVQQGEPLRCQLLNGLPQPTAVHWHGIRLDNAMDGVPGLTQDVVAPGATFDYAFTPPDAGTYWYHSHNRSTEQVGRGLHGLLIINDKTPPDVDADLSFVLDDWLLDPQTAQIDSDFDNLHALSHAGRLGNLITVNGLFESRREVARHQRLRLRLLNAANSRTFALGLEGLDGWIVALDGMPLSEPERVGETWILAPGQRVDILADVIAETGAEAFLIGFEREGGFALANFAVTSDDAQARRPAPPPLAPNPVPEIEQLSDAPVQDLLMEGGAMGGMREARLSGRKRSMRELMDAGQFWAFNGVIGLPEEPLFMAWKGETRRIRMNNETAFPHAMHLHGHHFREVLPTSELGPLRDSFLLERGEVREIAFVADNPGDWLLHCHMLEHQAAGMKTWIRVRS